MLFLFQPMFCGFVSLDTAWSFRFPTWGEQVINPWATPAQLQSSQPDVWVRHGLRKKTDVITLTGYRLIHEPPVIRRGGDHPSGLVHEVICLLHPLMAAAVSCHFIIHFVRMQAQGNGSWEPGHTVAGYLGFGVALLVP